MRKVTQQAVNALYSRRPFRNSNTEVEVRPNVAILKLHGNEIAYLHSPDQTLEITNAGWPTPTTKERLNGLKSVHIVQRKGKWYLNGKEWDGKLINVTNETTKQRLEEIRQAIREGSVSYGEIAELQNMSHLIDEGDVELKEWAGLPE